VSGADQVVVIEDASEVDERPRWRGDRDAHAPGSVGERKVPSMRGHAAGSAADRGGDIGHRTVAVDDLPQGGGAAVAQHGTVAAGQDRGQPARLPPRSAMADGEHGGGHVQQAAGR
jgi:hypothetical protein